MENELTRIQLQLDKHSGQIAKLFSKIDDTNLCIQKINNSLMQIKWAVYGALGWYFITEIGIIEAMRLAI
jgi:hypothetical protein|tara:strand:+ start:1716 stop:1925 length:210 start_codon:yes stop_codon:yes gene_type:complete